MDGVIDFTPNATTGPGRSDRHLMAAAAMRRYVPHTVAWCCREAEASIAVTLPEELSVSDLLRRAARERVELAPGQDPGAPDRTFELHYAHLGEAEIEEGIRRLGHCLARYSEAAARWAPGQPGSLVGI